MESPFQYFHFTRYEATKVLPMAGARSVRERGGDCRVAKVPQMIALEKRI